MTIFKLLDILPTKDVHLFKTALANLFTRAFSAVLVDPKSKASWALSRQIKEVMRIMAVEEIVSDAALERYYEQVISQEKLALAQENPPADYVSEKFDNEALSATPNEPIEPAFIPPMPTPFRKVQFAIGPIIEPTLDLLATRNMIKVYQVIPVGYSGTSKHFGLAQFIPANDKGLSGNELRPENKNKEIRGLFQHHLEANFSFTELANFLTQFNSGQQQQVGVLPFDAQLIAVGGGRYKHQQLAMLVEFMLPIEQLRLNTIKNGVEHIVVYEVQQGVTISEEQLLSLRPLSPREYLNIGAGFRPSHLYELDYWPNEDFILTSPALVQLQQQVAAATTANRHTFYQPATSSSAPSVPEAAPSSSVEEQAKSNKRS